MPKWRKFAKSGHTAQRNAKIQFLDQFCWLISSMKSSNSKVVTDSWRMAKYTSSSCGRLNHWLPVWPDRANFESSCWQILLQKLPKYLATLRANLKKGTVEYKELFLLFRQVLENISKLFISTSGHTADYLLPRRRSRWWRHQKLMLAAANFILILNLTISRLIKFNFFLLELSWIFE